MDIGPSPPPATAEPEAGFTASPIFALMLEQLADALPPLATDTPASAARRLEIARAMVIAAHPTDPIEAALAISAAIAYQAALTNGVLAAAPDCNSVQSSRHARTAIAQHRAFHAGVAALAKHRAPLQRTRRPSHPQSETEAVDDTPIPHLPQFQPRDRHGNPIPLYRFQDMTPKQRRATYGSPDDTAAWATATEEEEAAIAEQKALDGAAQTSA